MRPFLAAVIIALLAVAGCANAPSVDHSAPQPSRETSVNDPAALAEGLAVIRCGRPAPAETEDVARVVSVVIGDLVAFVERQGCPRGNNPFSFCDVPQCRGEISGRQ
jgi:hypothetical protein